MTAQQHADALRTAWQTDGRPQSDAEVAALEPRESGARINPLCGSSAMEGLIARNPQLARIAPVPRPVPHPCREVVQAALAMSADAEGFEQPPMTAPVRMVLRRDPTATLDAYCRSFLRATWHGCAIIGVLTLLGMAFG